MNQLLLYINWNPDQIAFSIGSFSFRWYSLCWLVGLLLAYIIVKKNSNFFVRKKKVFNNQLIDERTVKTIPQVLKIL